uniref:Uncharacterized protein n=1 Tax=Cucumis sativus TaxID=3659 RepID=A0A0A0KF56_CUCSA
MNQALTTPPTSPPPCRRPWRCQILAPGRNSGLQLPLNHKPNSSRIHAEDKLQLQVFCSGDLRRLQRFLSNRFHSQ